MSHAYFVCELPRGSNCNIFMQSPILSHTHSWCPFLALSDCIRTFNHQPLLTIETRSVTNCLSLLSTKKISEIWKLERRLCEMGVISISSLASSTVLFHAWILFDKGTKHKFITLSSADCRYKHTYMRMRPWRANV